jgi:hypothetical protein
MFECLLTAVQLRQEPLVLLDDGLYAKTRSTDGEVELVTAHGVRHPMRRIGTMETLQSQWRRALAQPVRRHVEDSLARLLQTRISDLVALFLQLASETERHDFALPGQPLEAVVVTKAAFDVAGWIDAVTGHVPAVAFPTPGLCVLGRLWQLQPDNRVGPGVLHVVCSRSETLRLTGEFQRIGQLRVQADAAVRGHCEAALKDAIQHGAFTPEYADAVSQAWAAFDRDGSLQLGSLLLLPGAQGTSRVGYLLPPHYNATLGRNCTDDLAITSLFAAPPEIGGLAMMQRGSNDRWNPLSLPNGLCLGPGPPAEKHASPFVAYAAYLRWAAIRLARNGRFHERDGTWSNSDDGQYY